MNKTAVLALAAATTLTLPLAASAQSYPGHWYNNGNAGSYGQSGSRSGRIASVQGSSFTLDNGTTVFLHQGTVINPRGTSLQSGEFVNISGNRDGRGRLNADEVDITNGGGYNNGGYNGGYNGGGYNNGGNDDNGRYNHDNGRRHDRDDRRRHHDDNGNDNRGNHDDNRDNH